VIRASLLGRLKQAKLVFKRPTRGASLDAKTSDCRCRSIFYLNGNRIRFVEGSNCSIVISFTIKGGDSLIQLMT